MKVKEGWRSLNEFENRWISYLNYRNMKFGCIGAFRCVWTPLEVFGRTWTCLDGVWTSADRVWKSLEGVWRSLEKFGGVWPRFELDWSDWLNCRNMKWPNNGFWPLKIYPDWLENNIYILWMSQSNCYDTTLVATEGWVANHGRQRQI